MTVSHGEYTFHERTAPLFRIRLATTNANSAVATEGEERILATLCTSVPDSSQFAMDATEHPINHVNLAWMDLVGVFVQISAQIVIVSDDLMNPKTHLRARSLILFPQPEETIPL